VLDDSDLLGSAPDHYTKVITKWVIANFDFEVVPRFFFNLAKIQKNLKGWRECIALSEKCPKLRLCARKFGLQHCEIQKLDYLLKINNTLLCGKIT
jgi:hypothetical protein